jgi:basic membrane protein A
VTVKQAIKNVITGEFKGGVLVGTLANGGVGLAPFHNFDSKVPDQVKTDVKSIASDISSGKIKVADYLK